MTVFFSLFITTFFTSDFFTVELYCFIHGQEIVRQKNRVDETRKLWLATRLGQGKV